MDLKNQNILILVADEYEEMELHYPHYRMKEEGAKVVIAGQEAKKSYKGKHGYPCVADKSFEEINVDEFDGLIIPGGYAPDKLRTIAKAVEIVTKFNEEEKLIAFICHAGWLPISAKILKDIKVTSWASIKDDLINAGAIWMDEEVVVDRHFISSRCPDDLPFFCQAIIKFLTQESTLLQPSGAIF